MDANKTPWIRVRNTFLQGLALLSAFALASASATAQTDDRPPRPNIIVVLADDLGWGDISANGADLIETPNIDRLADEGARLTSFYAGANVCTPSRAALLTGRYPIRSGMQHVIFPHSTGGLPQSEVTVAEVLAEAGYATGMIGKWHLGHQDAHWPTEHGFQSFYGVAYSNDMAPFDLYRGKSVVQSPVDQSQATRAFSSEAAAFIEANADRPFFLYYAEIFPHIPLFVPEDRAGQSEAGLYGDVVQHFDEGIGVADNTLVIVTSDNGPWFEGSSGAYRDRKGGTFEGGYRVPFVARWPDGLPAGGESDAMTMAIDFLPTFAGLAGADLPDGVQIDGRDMIDVLRGSHDSPHEVLFFYNGNDIAAARNERFRLVLNTYYKTFYVPFEQFGALHLFDLERDPEERFSYLRDEPEAAEALLSAVKALREATADLVVEPESPFPAEDAVRGPQLSVDGP